MENVSTKLTRKKKKKKNNSERRLSVPGIERKRAEEKGSMTRSRSKKLEGREKGRIKRTPNTRRGASGDKKRSILRGEKKKGETPRK